MCAILAEDEGLGAVHGFGMDEHPFLLTFLIPSPITRRRDPSVRDCKRSRRGSMLTMCPMNGTVRFLSPRQREVLSLVVQNLTEKQIAKQLGISTHTVDTHLRNAYARMGAQSRVQAILLALHHRQLDLGTLVASIDLVA
jgi:DNA-binding CsgD family transcriptional regulator